MNIYGKEFIDLVNNSKEKLLVFPAEKTIKFFKDKKKYGVNVIELSYENFNKNLIKNCYKIAREKAKKTMDYNQAEEKRDKKIKIVNQFKGVLAEAIVHLYLHYECKISLQKIHRYDLERENFEYNQEEYDIKLDIDDSNTLQLEIRSSNNPFKNLSSYLMKRGVICAYVNNVKQQENFKDISISVIYDLLNHIGPLGEEKIFNFFKDFKENNYKIYLILHCSTKECCESCHEIKSYNQRETKYMEVPFWKISNYEYHLKNIINNIVNKVNQNV